MWNPMQKKMVLILLLFVFVMTISGAASAASGTSITSTTTNCDKITKNVTNLNASKTTINYNDTVNYTIKVRNDHSKSYNFRVNDTLPAGLEFVSYTSTKGTYNATTGIWNIGSLVGSSHTHGSAVLNIIAKVTVADTCITNTAKLEKEDKYWDWHKWCFVNYWDYEAKANTTFCVPKAADLQINKTVNNTHPNYKDTITWTVTARNNGPNCATGVKVNDSIPAGLEFVSYTSTPGTSYDPNTGIWTIGNLDTWCQAVLNIITKVNTSCTTLTNTANITGCEYDPCLVNNNANASICIPCAADLQINKTVNNTHPNYRDYVNWTITAKNKGPNNATGVKVSDLIPAGLEFVSYTATPGTSYDPNTGIWTIGNLNSWCQAVLNIITKVNTTNTCITNCANITGYEYDPCLTNNNANATICISKAADLEVCKTVNNTHPQYMETVNWTVTAKNKGPNCATGVKVNDSIPAGLEFVSYTATQGTYDPCTGIWYIGDLDSWCDAVLNIITKVNTSCTTLTNTANITGCEYDPCLTNNNANASICIPCAADLQINKTVNNTHPKYGDYVNWTVTAKNKGPNNATGVKVSDLIPAGLEFVSYTATPGTSYNPNTGIWTIGNLDTRCQAVLNIITKVNTTNTCITNTANITGCEYDPCLANNNANASICVPAQSNLYVKIIAPTKCLGIGNIAQIVFKVGNRGPDPAGNTIFTWTIPEGMEYVSASVDQGTVTYDPFTRTITWDLGNVAVGDPYLWVTTRILKEGTFEIKPTLCTSTYDPDLKNNIEFANVCGKANGGGSGGNGTNTVKAATVPLHKTGLPIGFLVAAILMVFAGLAPKRK